MDKKQLNDDVFEALLKRAVVDNFYEEYNAIAPLDELAKDYTFSKEHELRMKHLFAREKGINIIKKVTYITRKTVAAVIILAVFTFGALMFSPNVRAAVVNTVITWKQKFVSFVSTDTDTQVASKEPTFIPTGFIEEFREKEKIDISSTIYFVNEDGLNILFQSIRVGASLSVDSENIEYDILEINDIKYHRLLATDSDEKSIIWEIDGWRYFLSSTISIDILQKMAFSLE